MSYYTFGKKAHNTAYFAILKGFLYDKNTVRLLGEYMPFANGGIHIEGYGHEERDRG